MRKPENTDDPIPRHPHHQAPSAQYPDRVSQYGAQTQHVQRTMRIGSAYILLVMVNVWQTTNEIISCQQARAWLPCMLLWLAKIWKEKMVPTWQQGQLLYRFATWCFDSLPYVHCHILSALRQCICMAHVYHCSIPLVLYFGMPR